jgi:hypothetical protein
MNQTQATILIAINAATFAASALTLGGAIFIAFKAKRKVAEAQKKAEDARKKAEEYKKELKAFAARIAAI